MDNLIELVYKKKLFNLWGETVAIKWSVEIIIYTYWTKILLNLVKNEINFVLINTFVRSKIKLKTF